MAEALIERLRTCASAAGLDAFGVAGAEPFPTARDIIEDRKSRGLHGGMWFTYGRPERSTDPSRIMVGAQSILVGALDYFVEPRDLVEPLPAPAGRVARYVWERHYERLGAALETVAEVLRAEGWRAEVVFDDNRLVDRAAAHRAGLGWFGKNTNLLIDGHGSWFVLGSIVTDCSLPPAPAPVEDGCGTCTRCQQACPTGALDVAGELDATRCLAWLVQADGVFPIEHREALGDRIYGCDECQEVCPPNVRHVRIRGLREASPHAQVTTDVLSMLASSDDELMATYGHWYVPRRRPDYLRRNALIVLANVADAENSAVLDAVTAAAQHDSAIVRAHALWAARRLGYHAVVDHAAHDEAPEVIAELAAHVVPRSEADR